MAQQINYAKHVDPEYRRWGREYPRGFPGIAECVRLIQDGKSRGAWADIIAWELAAHAEVCLTELTAAFNGDKTGEVKLYLLTALEDAAPVSAIPFLVNVMRDADSRLHLYAERTLLKINTRESRIALRQAGRTDASMGSHPPIT